MEEELVWKALGISYSYRSCLIAEKLISGLTPVARSDWTVINFLSIGL